MKFKGICLFIFLILALLISSCIGNGVDETEITVKDAYQTCFENAKEKFDGLTAEDFNNINPNVCNKINIYKRNDLASSCIRACKNAYSSYRMKARFRK